MKRALPVAWSSEQLLVLLQGQGPALVLYARSLGGSAEDVVQEAFVRLLQQPQPPENPRGWLFRVVRNLVREQQRSRRRRQQRERRGARGECWFQPDPDLPLDAQLVSEKLQRLPPEQREAVVAHLWGELSFSEVGQLLGVSRSRAYRLYRQALDQLREQLNVSVEEPSDESAR